MYVLCSPCILNPALRAEGITKPSDLALFSRVRERCRRFGVEMVPLPCPETIFLGATRQAGTFLERLNSPAFFRTMEDLEAQVREMIAQRGPPICMVGVNSSPTCGVTSTYYGSEGDLPPKRPRRGVFLARFPDIRHLMSMRFPATGCTLPHRSSRKQNAPIMQSLPAVLKKICLRCIFLRRQGMIRTRGANLNSTIFFSEPAGTRGI